MSGQTTVQTQVAAKPVVTPVANGLLQRQCACGQHSSAGGECEECKQKREGMLQRAAISPSPVRDVPPVVHDVLRSPGQPLDAQMRAYMEPRFGHDFSGVRVHTDARSAESARAVNALAYTVGRDVVFGTGQYTPHVNAGRKLIAHELTHVMQQRDAGVPGYLTVGETGNAMEREAEVASQSILTDDSQRFPTVRLQSNSSLRLVRQACPALPGSGPAAAGSARHFVQLISGRHVGDLSGADVNVREDVLSVLTNLNRLWSISNADFTAEQAQVSARPANQRLAPADIPRTIAALQRNEEVSINDQVALSLLGITLSASVSELRANAKADVYRLQDALHANWNITNHDYGVERARVNAGPDPVNNSDIPATLRGLVCFKAGFVGGTSRHGGVLAGTGTPTAQQTANRNAALITPGTQTTTTTVGGVTTVTRQGFVDTKSVGGVNRTYRQDLWHEMDAWVGSVFIQSQALLGRPRIGGSAPGDVSAFEPIGDAAKRSVDHAFGTYGQFGPRFHSGGNLLDASQRSGNAENMIDYLVDNQAELGVVRARHNADHSPGRPELTIATQFKTDYVADGNNRHRLEIIDQGWPALNSGGVVSIQPFVGATPAATRSVRWNAFQTMIHEYFHSLNHPNYYRYARQLGGDSESVLVEGGASLMTDHAWSRISPTISTDASLRAAVEGHPAAFTPSVISPITNAHYHPQFEQARDIETAIGGQPNFQAAFLTGRMELIGYQQATPASAAAAAGSQVYTVPPHGVRTLADVAYQTQTPVGQLAVLNGLAVDATVHAGQPINTRGMP